MHSHPEPAFELRRFVSGSRLGARACRRAAGRLLARALLLGMLLPGAFAPASISAQALEAETGSVPDRRAIADALARVKADPNVATERKVRTLQWRRRQTSPRAPSGLGWLVDFFRWVAQSARALVWVAAAVLAAMLAVYISRVVRRRVGKGRSERFYAPTHVQDLDIRPESLPDDIGSAARALWDRGERRAALALLYRGLLSRLAHVHQVPIRDSTTEGTCLVLAATHLSEERHEYASRLVRIWQRSVYGGHEADTTAVYALCTGFRAALDPVALEPAGSMSKPS